MTFRDLAAATLAGHTAQLDAQPAHRACPHQYTSSPAGLGLAGLRVAARGCAWLRVAARGCAKIGHPAPRDVRMSRCDTVRAGDMRVWLVDAAALVRVL